MDPSSPASAASTSRSSMCSGGCAPGSASATPTAAPCSIGTGPESLGSPTSPTSVPDASLSTSCAADSSARTSPTPDHVPGSTASEAAEPGDTSHGSFAIFDPPSHSWRTSQRSLLEDSTAFSRTLPPSGSMRNGRLYERATSGPRTTEIGFGSWPTPTASDYGSSQNGINGSGGENERPSAGTPSLRTMVRTGAGNWPTPTTTDAADAADAARTTTTTGIMRPGTMMLDAVRSHSSPLPTGRPTAPRHLTPGERGSPDALVVNPAFVEALMGLPVDWTRADDEPASLALAMPQSLDKPRRRSPSSSSEEPSK